MEKKMTAVEWLLQQIKLVDKESYNTIIADGQADQAKAMQRQQIESACIDFLRDCHEHINYSKYKSASDYFTQTYQQ